MRVVRDLQWQGPVPAGEGEYGEFFAAAAEGRLLIQQCPECGHRQHYPRAICTACGAEPEWMEAAGTGTVYTYTVVRQFGVPAFAELPYVLAMIDLPEGVRMFGGLTGIDPEAVEIGMPVTAYARTYDDIHAMVFWEPA